MRNVLFFSCTTPHRQNTRWWWQATNGFCTTSQKRWSTIFGRGDCSMSDSWVLQFCITYLTYVPTLPQNMLTHKIHCLLLTAMVYQKYYLLLNLHNLLKLWQIITINITHNLHKINSRKQNRIPPQKNSKYINVLLWTLTIGRHGTYIISTMKHAGQYTVSCMSREKNTFAIPTSNVQK